MLNPDGAKTFYKYKTSADLCLILKSINSSRPTFTFIGYLIMSGVRAISVYSSDFCNMHCEQWETRINPFPWKTPPQATLSPITMQYKKLQNTDIKCKFQ